MKKQDLFIFIIVLSILTLSFKVNDLPWEKISNEQTAKELKELEHLFSKKTSYSVKVKYNTYDSQSTEDVIKDKSEGYIIKHGQNVKSKLLGIYSVQNSQLRVTIDSSKKMIHVTNAFKTESPMFSLNDYMKILNFCKAVKKIKNNSLVAYRFETKNKEGVLAQEIYIENGIVKEANIYYGNEHAWREDNTIKRKMYYPKLQVAFSNYNDKHQFNEQDFSTEKILKTVDKKIVLNESYKGFKLIDGRIKK